jgi:hypothetical protein
MSSVFEEEKPRPDAQLYFYAVVVQASEPQIEKIKKMLTAQNVKIIFQMVDLGYLWIQRGRPEVKK